MGCAEYTEPRSSGRSIDADFESHPAFRALLSLARVGIDEEEIADHHAYPLEAECVQHARCLLGRGRSACSVGGCRTVPPQSSVTWLVSRASNVARSESTANGSVNF